MKQASEEGAEKSLDHTAPALSEVEVVVEIAKMRVTTCRGANISFRSQQTSRSCAGA